MMLKRKLWKQCLWRKRWQNQKKSCSVRSVMVHMWPMEKHMHRSCSLANLDDEASLGRQDAAITPTEAIIKIKCLLWFTISSACIIHEAFKCALLTLKLWWILSALFHDVCRSIGLWDNVIPLVIPKENSFFHGKTLLAILFKVLQYLTCICYANYLMFTNLIY